MPPRPWRARHHPEGTRCRVGEGLRLPASTWRELTRSSGPSTRHRILQHLAVLVGRSAVCPPGLTFRRARYIFKCSSAGRDLLMADPPGSSPRSRRGFRAQNSVTFGRSLGIPRAYHVRRQAGLCLPNSHARAALESRPRRGGDVRHFGRIGTFATSISRSRNTWPTTRTEPERYRPRSFRATARMYFATLAWVASSIERSPSDAYSAD